MYDSTTPADCPAGGDLYLYYCDGAYATTEAAVRALFPNAILVPISAIGTDAGVVGDCERFDMTPDDLVNWVLMRRAAGLDPTGYVNELNGWGPAKAAFAARGVPEPHWGVANYDGDPTIPAGAVFKQFRGSFRTPPQGTGAHYDQSSVADFWPGVDGIYGPGGGTIGGDDMPIMFAHDNTPGSGAQQFIVVEVDGLPFKRPLNGPEYANWTALGVISKTVPQAEIDAIPNWTPSTTPGPARSVSGSFTGTVS